MPVTVGLFHAKNLAKVLAEARDSGGLDSLDLIAVTRGTYIAMQSDYRTGAADVSCCGTESW